MKHLIILLALLALTTCTTRAPRFTDDQIATLKVGMTIDQVEAMLGPPWKLIEHPMDPQRLTYRYLLTRRRNVIDFREELNADRRGTTKMPVRENQYREIQLVFVDGKLMGER